MSTDLECPACGSSPADRNRSVEMLRRQFPKQTYTADLKDCPHCGHAKCLICDMGDSVPCSNCPDEEDE